MFFRRLGSVGVRLFRIFSRILVSGSYPGSTVTQVISGPGQIMVFAMPEAIYGNGSTDSERQMYFRERTGNDGQNFALFEIVWFKFPSDSVFYSWKEIRFLNLASGNVTITNQNGQPWMQGENWTTDFPSADIRRNFVRRNFGSGGITPMRPLNIQGNNNRVGVSVEIYT